MYADETAFSRTCICGKSFSRPETYTHHSRICTKTKQRLADALVKANEVRKARKRRRIGTLEPERIPDELPRSSPITVRSLQDDNAWNPEIAVRTIILAAD